MAIADILTEEFTQAVRDDIKDLIAQRKTIDQKLQGTLSLLTIAKREGREVPEEILESLRLILYGRKNGHRLLTRDF